MMMMKKNNRRAGERFCFHSSIIPARAMCFLKIFFAFEGDKSANPVGAAVDNTKNPETPLLFGGGGNRHRNRNCPQR